MNDGDRFDKFTERARKVLSLAEVEARRFQHNYIGTEHLLLGLVREGEGVAAKVLANLSVELNKVRSAVVFIIGPRDHTVVDQIGLTPRAKKVVELAVDEARRLNHHYIGTEHLLLGLVREGEGIAAGALESLGVNLEKVRIQTIQVLSQSVTPHEHDAKHSSPSNIDEIMIAEAAKALPNASQRLQLARKMFERATSGFPTLMLQLQLLQQVVRLDPFSVRYRLELVKSLQAQEMLEEAIVECGQALEFWPAAAPLQLLHGNLLIETGKIDEAKKCFDQARKSINEAKERFKESEDTPKQNELSAQVDLARLECDLRQADKQDWKKALDKLGEIEIVGNTAGLFCEKCLKIYIECDEKDLRKKVVKLAQEKAGAHPAYQLLERVADFDPQIYFAPASHSSQGSAGQSGLVVETASQGQAVRGQFVRPGLNVRHKAFENVDAITPQTLTTKRDGLEGLLTAYLLARYAPLDTIEVSGSLQNDGSGKKDSEEIPKPAGPSATEEKDHPQESQSPSEDGLKRLARWQTLMEEQSAQWFGLQEAYISTIDALAARAYQKKNFPLGATLWREVERVAPADPAVLQNLAITYTRLEDEKQYKWYWERLTHLWTLHGEMLPEASTYEKWLLQKHQAFVDGAQAKIEKHVPDAELAELGVIWVKEAVAYCALRQLAFRNVFFRCGLKTDDWADDKERRKLLVEGQSCMEQWLRQIAVWQNLGTQSELAQWRMQRLSAAVKQVEQSGQESDRYYKDEKEAFEQYREFMFTSFLLLFFSIAGKLLDTLDFSDKTARSQYAEIARGLLSFPHSLLEPHVRKTVKRSDIVLSKLVRNYAVEPYLKQATLAMKNKSFAQAVDYLEDLLMIVPNSLPGLFYLTICHMNLEHWDETQEVAQRGLKHCVDTDKETQEIKEELTEILAQFPTIKIAKELHSAREAMQRKRWREALKSLDAGLIKLPNELIAVYYKAICHFRLEEWDAAENTAKRALPLCQTDKKEHKEITEDLQALLFQIPLARVEREMKQVQQDIKLKRWKEALTQLNAIVARVPEHVPARFYQAVCHFRLENWQQATQVAQQALPLTTTHPEYKPIREQLQEIIKAARDGMAFGPFKEAMQRENWSGALLYIDMLLTEPTYRNDATVRFYRALCMFREVMQRINTRQVWASQSLLDPVDQALDEASRCYDDGQASTLIASLRANVERVRQQLRTMGHYY